MSRRPAHVRQARADEHGTNVYAQLSKIRAALGSEGAGDVVLLQEVSLDALRKTAICTQLPCIREVGHRIDARIAKPYAAASAIGRSMGTGPCPAQEGRCKADKRDATRAWERTSKGFSCTVCFGSVIVQRARINGRLVLMPHGTSL